MSQPVAGTKEALYMTASVERLVRRIHRRLQLAGSGRSIPPLGRRERAELEARVQRLRARDDRFMHVRLSSFVAGVGATNVPGRVGGECVAKEV